VSGGDIGKAGEDAAARYLRKNGCKILERNFSTPLGEIDIIALDGEVVCFVEVRSRSSADFGSAVEKLPRRKQRQVTKAALAYLKTKHLEDVDIRFDYAAVVIPGEGKSQVEFIRDAFQPRESMRGR
jgi:putative endonuclease